MSNDSHSVWLDIYKMIVGVSFVICIVLSACDNNDVQTIENETPQIKSIDLYSTEEFQAALGFLAIRNEMAKEVADVDSIKIREIVEVQKHKYDDPNYVGFNTIFTYNIAYNNENAGMSLVKLSVDVENTGYNLTIRDEVSMTMNARYYKSCDTIVKLDNVNKILGNYNMSEMTRVLTERESEYYK